MIRQNSRARARTRARESLIEAMGGQCRDCLRRDFLEMHFTGGSGREHHRMNSTSRQLWYFEQFRKGQLVLLCTACHRAETVRARTSAAALAVINASRAGAGLPALPFRPPK